MKLININEDLGLLRLMVYGNAGSGKTSFCASLGLDDRTAPVLHLDALGNPVSIKRFKGYRGTVIGLTQLGDLNPIFDWLYNGQPTNHSFLTGFEKAYGYALEPGFKSLVIDGLTKVQMLAFNLAMGSIAQVGKLLPSPEIAHYKQILIQMTNDCEHFYNLPLHVVITALEDKEPIYTKPGKIMQKGDKMGQEDREGYYQFAPAIDGKSIRLIQAAAQTVVRFKSVALAEPLELAEAKALNNSKAPKYSIAQFNQTREVYAKDQHNFGISYIGDLSVTQLLDRIERK